MELWSTTEAVILGASQRATTLTAAGLGQSTAVSIGGGAIIGQTYAELMLLFEADEDTQANVINTSPAAG